MMAHDRTHLRSPKAYVGECGRMKKGICVLSLFDGISSGHVALERAGMKVDKYFASEIDKYAIAVARSHYPNTVQLGDVEGWRNWDIDFREVDLILAGSPCQGFSFAGKQFGFHDARSRLFFAFEEILGHIRLQNPNVKFLLENVPMKNVYADMITKLLGVRSICIDSALVSAQMRKRLYWTNIVGVESPADKHIHLEHVMHEYTDIPAGNMNAKELDTYKVSPDKPVRFFDNAVRRRKIGYFGTADSAANRIYASCGKSVTLMGSPGGGGKHTGNYLFGVIRSASTRQYQDVCQRKTEKSSMLTTLRNGICEGGYVRHLTPVECERLQTLPNHYTDVVYNGKSMSRSRRYMLLGQAWTVDVIAHILSYMAAEA